MVAERVGYFTVGKDEKGNIKATNVADVILEGGKMRVEVIDPELKNEAGYAERFLESCTEQFVNEVQEAPEEIRTEKMFRMLGNMVRGSYGYMAYKLPRAFRTARILDDRGELVGMIWHDIGEGFKVKVIAQGIGSEDDIDWIEEKLGQETPGGKTVADQDYLQSFEDWSDDELADYSVENEENWEMADSNLMARGEFSDDVEDLDDIVTDDDKDEEDTEVQK